MWVNINLLSFVNGRNFLCLTSEIAWSQFLIAYLRTFLSNSILLRILTQDSAQVKMILIFRWSYNSKLTLEWPPEDNGWFIWHMQNKTTGQLYFFFFDLFPFSHKHHWRQILEFCVMFQHESSSSCRQPPAAGPNVLVYEMWVRGTDIKNNTH